MATTILRMIELKRKVKLSRTSIYSRVADGDFPKPISLGGRSIGWLEEEIDSWLKKKVASRDVLTGGDAALVGDQGQLPVSIGALIVNPRSYVAVRENRLRALVRERQP